MPPEEIPAERQMTDAERQYEWRTCSIDKLIDERASRLRKLESREESVRRALQAYRDLTAWSSTVYVRSEFVALRNERTLPPALGGPELKRESDRSTRLEDDYRTRPPCTKLLMHKTHALPTYLTILYVAHAEYSAGVRVRANAWRAGGVESWSVLCGRWAPTVRARRARLTRDLDELQRADLVTFGQPGTQARYENFCVLADDTTDKVYKLPKPSQAHTVIALPNTFFTNGWHLVLTPSETAVLLMARHAAQARITTSIEPGVGLTRQTRWSVYGISGEAYDSIHELAEFGLLTVHDTMPHRRHGKLRLLPPVQRAAAEASGRSSSPVPYRLESSPDSAFDYLALDRIRECLRNHATPPRLDPS